MMILVRTFKFFLKCLVIYVIISTLTTYIRLSKGRRKHYKELNIWKVSEDVRNKNKYLLVWTEGDGVDWEFFKETDTTFKENRCVYNNCYVTTDRKYFGKDYTQFDAVLFNSKYVDREGYRLPKRRSSEQLYIFASKDSSANNPICDPKFDDFFNLTWTYKLDSDVPWPYFTIYDQKYNEVAPKIEVEWTKIYEPVEGELELLVAEKEFAAIWIASNCFTNSKRETLYNTINFALKRKNFKVDSVGVCGLIQCPLDLELECLKHMYKYYFYFAFENSLAKDFVTEKVVKAVRNYVVPIVFGDADYNRFLPPHSYINAMTLGAEKTAKLIEHLIEKKNKNEYLDYFRWRNHYDFQQNDRHVCRICELLNTDVTKTYRDFRNWWNPESLKAFGAKPKKVC
ncbi:hypothetical protein O0L34_g10408 [Tuta absoluta]|nr:hypothetical protein O0L34_g10408 [Tuta absoluta]